MRVRFWGTRGSIPKPGPSTLRYGGNTSCVEVRSSAGTLVVIDCGSGAHGLGQSLMATERRPLRGHILIGHTHWDHIQGLPFFAPFFIPGNEWDVYGPHGLSQSLRDVLAGQMQHIYFPISLENFAADVRYHDLVEGTFKVGDITVRTQYLNHPALTLGYRLEADGVAVVYACDHEPHARQLAAGSGELVGQDRRHAEFLADADLVIHDAQYTTDEYPQKIGWGHSTVDYAVMVSRHARARRLAISHHDPLRDDDALDRLVEAVRADRRRDVPPLEVFAAAEGQVVDLEAGADTDPGGPAPDEVFAVRPGSPALVERSILLAVADPATADIFRDAVQSDDIRVILATDGDSALRMFESERPSLVILEQSPPRIDAEAVCRVIRRSGGAAGHDVPIIIVAAQDDVPADADAGATDWLARPFSSVYARARVRAWLMRTVCRWMKAPLPEDEERRLAALRALGILDMRPEERFDRFTRLAAALFDVPIALVTLVDRERQWFKSCHGLAARGTSREVSFCAHAILRDEVMLVPDALRDPRFADNPAVAGEPRIRFYAGYPLTLPGGNRVGTLCLVDTRPRQLDEAGIALLRDLGDLVERELSAPTRRA